MKGNDSGGLEPHRNARESPTLDPHTSLHCFQLEMKSGKLQHCLLPGFSGNRPNLQPERYPSRALSANRYKELRTADI
jgi:hypothetical protein